MLQDLITGHKVKFFTDIAWPSSGGPCPMTLEEHELFAGRTIEFVVKRNERIKNWLEG